MLLHCKIIRNSYSLAGIFGKGLKYLIILMCGIPAYPIDLEGANETMNIKALYKCIVIFRNYLKALEGFFFGGCVKCCNETFI